MPRDLSPTNDELLYALGVLMRRVLELGARIDALQILLRQHADVSDEEYDQTVAELLRNLDMDISEAGQLASREAVAASLRRLLESFEGTKQ